MSLPRGGGVYVGRRHEEGGEKVVDKAATMMLAQTEASQKSTQYSSTVCLILKSLNLWVLPLKMAAMNGRLR